VLRQVVVLKYSALEEYMALEEGSNLFVFMFIIICFYLSTYDDVANIKRSFEGKTLKF
jgi:hypothetical protein